MSETAVQQYFISANTLLFVGIIAIVTVLSSLEIIYMRACLFPLPNGPEQVKRPVGQLDLDRFFFFISYKQIEEF